MSLGKILAEVLEAHVEDTVVIHRKILQELGFILVIYDSAPEGLVCLAPLTHPFSVTPRVP